MPDENVIGGVKVEIEGDFSPLEKDFQEAVSLAVQAGATLADAIQSSLPLLDPSPITEAMQAVGNAAQGSAEQLSLFGNAADSIPFQEASGQLNLFSTELETFNSVAGQTPTQTEAASTGIHQVSEESAHAAESAHEAGEQMHEFFERLMELGGIAFTLEALKELITETLGTYAAVQKAEISLEALTGSAFKAASAIEELKKTATDKALSFPELVQAQQRMTAFGFEAEQIPRAMEAAADAAAAMDKGFGDVAGAIERMAISGMAGSRQLVSLGIGTADLARVMGTAEGNVKKMFKALDESQRVEVLTEALEKFHGVADKAAKGLAGQWQIFKTEAEFAMEDVGKALAPLALQFLDFLRETASSLAPFLEGIKHIAEEFGKLDTPSKTLAIDLAAVFVLGPVVAYTLAVLQLGDAMLGLIAAQKIADKANADADKALKTLEISMRQQGIDISAIQEKYGSGQISQVQYLQGLKGLADEFHKTHPEILKHTLEVLAAAAGHKKFAGSVANTEEELNKLQTRFNVMGPLGNLLTQEIKQQGEAYPKLVAETARYNNEMRDMIAGFKDLTPIQLAAKHLDDFRKNLKDIEKEAPILDLSAYSPIFVDTAKRIDDISASLRELQKKALDNALAFKKLEDAENTLGIKGTAYYQHQVDVAQQAYDDILESGLYTDNELDQASAQLALKQAEYALRMGEISQSVYDDLVKAVKADLAELDGSAKASAEHRGRYEKTLGEELVAINDKTFKSISRGLADSIVDLKGFGDLWKTLWKGLAKDLLDIMFTALLNPLKNAIGNVLGGITGGVGGAAGSAAGGAGSVGSAAAGAAGTGFTAIAGLVTGAISAVTGVISVFQNMHQETSLNAIEHNTRYAMMYLGERADGGILGVMFRVLDQVSFGVIVKAAEESRNILGDIRSILQSGGGMGHSGAAAVAVASGGGSMAAGYGVNVDLRGAHLSGDLTDSQVRDVFDRGIRKSKLAGAFRPGVFPQ